MFTWCSFVVMPHSSDPLKCARLYDRLRLCRSLEHRGYRAARSTPRGPEIGDHGNFDSVDVVPKPLAIQGDRLAREELPATLAACSALSGTLTRNTAYAVAVGADDVVGDTHQEAR